MESDRRGSGVFRIFLDVGDLFVRASFLASGCVLALSGCGNGRLGELQLKPIYAELSGLYYGGVCEGTVNPGATTESVRAVRIGTIAGDCAVLYLDGLDGSGEFVIYGAKVGDRPECAGLNRKLEVGRANAAVLAKAKEVCR